MEDLQKIKKENNLIQFDKKKALMLSNYLVALHKNKFKGKKEITSSIYKRHLRDCMGHGEMLLGVIDTYPRKIKFTRETKIISIIKKFVELREKLKGKHYRLCRIHGDFHPGNILFQNKKSFVVLDASRELYGDPADDLTTMAINYIWFALMHKDNFFGPFKKLFEIFWKNYIRKTGDIEINKIAPLFFAFRGVVVAHPIFYKNQTDETRKKIFNFINKVLDEEKFDYKKINSYIK
jgi:thiamine kinase-like enzyme